MRARYSLLGVVIGLTATAQTVYSWEDEQGVHYTDDPATIPSKARKLEKSKYDDAPAVVVKAKLERAEKVERVERPDKHEVDEQTAAPSPTTAPTATPADVEAQWRTRFIELYRRIAFLKESVNSLSQTIPPPMTCMPSSVPGYSAHCVPNPENARIRALVAQNTAQLHDSERELEQLDRDASQQGIPREWRRGF